MHMLKRYAYGVCPTASDTEITLHEFDDSLQCSCNEAISICLMIPASGTDVIYDYLI